MEILRVSKSVKLSHEASLSTILTNSSVSSSSPLSDFPELARSFLRTKAVTVMDNQKTKRSQKYPNPERFLSSFNNWSTLSSTKKQKPQNPQTPQNFNPPTTEKRDKVSSATFSQLRSFPCTCFSLSLPTYQPTSIFPSSSNLSLSKQPQIQAISFLSIISLPTSTPCS